MNELDELDRPKGMTNNLKKPKWVLKKMLAASQIKFREGKSSPNLAKEIV